MTQNTSFPEENMVQALALRLLGRPFDLRAPQPQLLAGRLPDQLPFTLPLPDEHTIIGSFISNPEEIQIVLDTPQAAAAVIAFYKEQMQTAGWSEPAIQHRMNEGGFVHTYHRPASSIILCKGPHGPALMVSAFAEQHEGESTDVRIHIDTRSRNSPCRQSSRIFMEVGGLIPPLEPPAGGRQMGGGGGGSNSESASTAATLEMEHDTALPTLADHYAHQLEQAGWQRTGEGSSGPMVWHTWEFRDTKNELWGGVFTSLQIPGMERNYNLHVLINWLGDRSR
ncbi:MAG: hypothetical protein M3Y39_17855 [Chloroflexota bacterium]|nr:hypothetical protein [Chloroflexota bacterium]